jgi:hypothetical protein
VKNNIPAFPHVIKQETYMDVNTGMTLRDWFAGQALPAMIEMEYGKGLEIIAAECYRYADAMLEQRSKGEG